jgi:hypothetical protein
LIEPAESFPIIFIATIAPTSCPTRHAEASVRECRALLISRLMPRPTARRPSAAAWGMPRAVVTRPDSAGGVDTPRIPA